MLQACTQGSPPAGWDLLRGGPGLSCRGLGFLCKNKTNTLAYLDRSYLGPMQMRQNTNKVDTRFPDSLNCSLGDHITSSLLPPPDEKPSSLESTPPPQKKTSEISARTGFDGT